MTYILPTQKDAASNLGRFKVHTASWSHSERTAWLLLVNPVFVIGESSPITDPETYEKDGRAKPGFFASAHQTLSDARVPSARPTGADFCTYPESGYEGGDPWQVRQQAMAIHPRQPWVGLGFYGLLGIGSMVITVRRLRAARRSTWRRRGVSPAGAPAPM